MSNQPLVSIIMPAYQGEKFIKEAINSIINQTYSNWELIIIEDASEDNTKSIIESIDDNRIRKIYHSENKGIAFSTNEGIGLSRGEYIAFLDDDDVACLERLELEVSFLQAHEDIDIVGGRVTAIDENGKTICDWDIPRNNPYYIRAMLLFRFVDFSFGTLLVRKSFFKNSGIEIRENCLGMQDFQFMIEASKVCKITTIPEFLLKTRHHEDNETKRQRKNNSQAREKRYAEMQKESIEKSGFILGESSIKLINNSIKEQRKTCEDTEQFIELCKTFQNMIKQAKEEQMDFANELGIFLNKELIDILNDMKTLK